MNDMSTTEIIAFEMPKLPAPGEVVQKLESEFQNIYDKIEREIAGFTPDVSTATGRKKIASLAHKIARTKTAMDAEAGALTDESRKLVDSVNKARREMRDYLDRRKEEFRKPLTEWEVAEEERQERVIAMKRWLQSASRVDITETSTDVAMRLAEVRAAQIKPEDFLDELEAAEQIRDLAAQTLDAAHARLVKEEADRAELARLRAEAEERARKEAAAKAEEERKAREAAEEQARKEREAAAAERARAEAERAAQEKIEAAERQAREAEERAKKAADDAREAERQRQEKIAKEKALADEIERRAAERRAANQKHRETIRVAAIRNIVRYTGISDEDAKKVVTAIETGSIPNITIAF